MPPRSTGRLSRRGLLAGAGTLLAVGRLRGARAAEELFDPDLLRQATERAAGLDQLRALVLARRGRLVLARAFRGPPPERAVTVKSVSKTIVASLAGAALDRGLLPGVDATMAEVAPDLIPASADPRAGRITIGQLLTMQAGLEPTSGPGYGRWVGSRNWVSYALTRPFVAEPGERMLYSTGSYHLLGAVLARRAGRDLLALARGWLGEPLGIALAPWTRDPQGFYLGGNNMLLSPLALLRFGEMWRAGGLWQDRRVLSASWTAQSWTPRTRSPFSGHDYGYGWFLTEARGHRIAYARGYGGQMLYVVPSLELTMVVTSDPGRAARSQGYAGDLNALLADGIIPAAEGA